jgi:hypothetical protein
MLKHEEFENICQAVKSGQEKHLKHIVTHQTGKIVGCNSAEEFFEVEVPTGEHKNWSKENVKETT